MKIWQKGLLLAIITILCLGAGLEFGYMHPTRPNKDGTGIWAKDRVVFFSRDLEPGTIIAPEHLTVREVRSEYAYSKPQIRWFDRELLSIDFDQHSTGYYPKDLPRSAKSCAGKKTRRKVKSGQIVCLYDIESADLSAAASK